MKQTLIIVQIVVAFLLIVSIILQNKSEGIGRAFGTETSSFSTRRGVEKSLYIFTIVLVIAFIATSIANFAF